MKSIILAVNAYFLSLRRFRYINVIFFCCHWLAMSNSSVNPFIYAIYTVIFAFAFLLITHIKP